MESEAPALVSAPFSVDMEQAVLGSLLIDAEQVPVVRGVIQHAGEFFIQRHHWIWQAICALDDQKTVADIATVADELERKERLAEVGGPAYLVELLNCSPNSLNAEGYARKVHDYAVRRALLRSAEEIANLAIETDRDLEETFALCTRSLASAGGELAAGSGQDVEELAPEHAALMRERKKNPGLPGIPSGLKRLDKLLGGGFHPGQLTLVAGFPGMGKTAFLTTAALHASQNWYVAFFSLEMSRMDMMDLFMAQLTGIDSQTIHSAKLREKEWKLYDEASIELASLKLRIEDRRPLWMAGLRARCVQLRAQGKLDLIVVDYAGLLSAPGDNDYERYSLLSRNLKDLAGETNCPVLAAQQMNRKARDFENPGLQHLRGSGTWEQDSDNVILIYESKKQAAGTGYMGRVLDLAKHRRGPVDRIEARIMKVTARFEEGD